MVINLVYYSNELHCYYAYSDITMVIAHRYKICYIYTYSYSYIHISIRGTAHREGKCMRIKLNYNMMIK